MKFLSFFIALIMMSRLSVIGVMFTYVYYAMLIIVLVFISVRGLCFRDLKLDLKSVSFLFVGFLSLALNDVSSRNEAWLRLGGFAAIMLVFGPLIKSDFSANIKKYIFHYSKIIIIILTILSFFAYILSISFAFKKGINGVFNHSMVLSPMAAISALICLDKILHNQHTIFTKQRFFFTILFCSSLFISIIAKSRGAVLALIIAILVYLICRYRRNKKRLVFSIVVSVILGFTVIYYNPMHMLDGLMQKMDRPQEEMLSGRDEMWEDRIADFKDSPLVGVGFGTFKETFNSKIDIYEGTQESGSSWFFILGSMGLLGILTYSLLLFVPVIKVWINNFDVGLNIAIVFFFTVHTAIEGYAIAFGSSLCAIMWLNIGVLNSYFLQNRTL